MTMCICSYNCLNMPSTTNGIRTYIYITYTAEVEAAKNNNRSNEEQRIYRGTEYNDNNQRSQSIMKLTRRK